MSLIGNYWVLAKRHITNVWCVLKPDENMVSCILAEMQYFAFTDSRLLYLNTFCPNDCLCYKYRVFEKVNNSPDIC